MRFKDTKVLYYKERHVPACLIFIAQYPTKAKLLLEQALISNWDYIPQDREFVHNLLIKPTKLFTSSFGKRICSPTQSKSNDITLCKFEKEIDIIRWVVSKEDKKLLSFPSLFRWRSSNLKSSDLQMGSQSLSTAEQ